MAWPRIAADQAYAEDPAACDEAFAACDALAQVCWGDDPHPCPGEPGDEPGDGPPLP
ncbi:MAG: hypothetical protein ACE37F_05665 [Nannocystaceae bacterium]|nr:hypothetical protein [bacterium]